MQSVHGDHRNQLEQVSISEFPRGAPVLWCVQSYNMCEGEKGSMLTFLNTDTLYDVNVQRGARRRRTPLWPRFPWAFSLWPLSVSLLSVPVPHLVSSSNVSSSVTFSLYLPFFHAHVHKITKRTTGRIFRTIDFSHDRKLDLPVKCCLGGLVLIMRYGYLQNVLSMLLIWLFVIYNLCFWSTWSDNGKMKYCELGLSAGTQAIIGAKFSEFEKFQQCRMAVVWVEGKQWQRAQCLHH